jgi:hypothetical protein
MMMFSTIWKNCFQNLDFLLLKLTKIKRWYENGKPQHHSKNMLCAGTTHLFGFGEDLEEDNIQNGAGSQTYK